MTSLSKRLPSMSALVVLEAAARLGSFTHAARELHITQSAVSHQIRALEEELGHALFERGPRGSKPTPRALALAASTRDALERIASCTERVFSTGARPPLPDTLTLGAPPSLGTMWLARRLAAFQRRHPGKTLQPMLGLSFQDLSGGEVDATIRYGLGGYAPLASELLARERLVAVCAPELARELGRPEDLLAHPLLQAYTATTPRPEPPITTWSRHVVDLSAAHVVSLNRQSTALLSAIEAQGVGVVPLQIARDALARGEVVEPFDHRALDPMSYFLVWDPLVAPVELIELLLDWLSSELEEQT